MDKVIELCVIGPNPFKRGERKYIRGPPLSVRNPEAQLKTPVHLPLHKLNKALKNGHNIMK